MTKFLHVALHLCTLVCAAIAITAMVKFKVATTGMNMYSFHSWVGVTVISLYSLQVNFFKKRGF